MATCADLNSSLVVRPYRGNMTREKVAHSGASATCLGSGGLGTRARARPPATRPCLAGRGRVMSWPWVVLALDTALEKLMIWCRKPENWSLMSLVWLVFLVSVVGTVLSLGELSSNINLSSLVKFSFRIRSSEG